MQTTDTILLIRPASFSFNRETATNNHFQNEPAGDVPIVSQAVFEFDKLALELTQAGVEAIVIDDTQHPAKPDAVFPNNWISFHENLVVLYPMCASSRRSERRQDILDILKERFVIDEVVDVSHFESQQRFLEGTGSMVLDRINRIAYACLSPRTDLSLFREVCERLSYQPLAFHAVDQNGMPIYHTNVMMNIGRDFAVICLDSISDPGERDQVLQSLKNTGHEVIDITFDQINQFAGNMMALHNRSGEPLLAMSQRAFQTLNPEQKCRLQKYTTLLPLDVSTIESVGGGSVRCMIAEVFLEKNHPLLHSTADVESPHLKDIKRVYPLTHKRQSRGRVYRRKAARTLSSDNFFFAQISRTE